MSRAELESIPNAQVEAVVAAARDLITLTRDSNTVSFLSQWPVDMPVSRVIAPRALPVLRWLDVAPRFTAAATRAFVQALVDVAPSLAWAQTYSADDFGSVFLERYGWTELIGLRGPVASTQIAAGILLLGPETKYPLHSHEAEELYVPVAGTAQWSAATAIGKRGGRESPSTTRLASRTRCGPKPNLCSRSMSGAVRGWRRNLRFSSSLAVPAHQLLDQALLHGPLLGRDLSH